MDTMFLLANPEHIHGMKSEERAMNGVDMMRHVSTISSPRYGWHCTTEHKLQRYVDSGMIMRPVRFWPTKELAEKWAKKTGRFVIKIELPSISYPLPDHKPALWCPNDVINFNC